MPENTSLAALENIVSLAYPEESFQMQDINAWIENPENDFEYVALITILKSPLGDDFKKDVITNWLEKSDDRFEVNELEEVLPLLQDIDTQRDVVKLWFAQDPVGITYDEFVSVISIDSLYLKYDSDYVAFTYKECILPKNKILNLCNELYPDSEAAQAELVIAFIRNEVLTARDIGAIIKTFIVELEDDTASREVIKELKYKLRISELRVLDIASDRLASKYESVSDLLIDEPVEDALTENGLVAVKRLFGEDVVDNWTLADLFSYYDIRDEVSDFKRIIQEDVLRRIIAEFTPSGKSAYVRASEYKKLQQLVSADFSKVADLCTYLESVVPSVPKLDVAEIAGYSINFTNAVSVEEDKQDEILAKFKALLLKDLSDEDSTEQVAAFFKKAFNIEAEITDDNKEKLKEVFACNKEKLAYLFAQEGGLDAFAGCIGSLGDGCVANISTQVSSAVHRILIRDVCDQVLYSCYYAQVFLPILEEGDHLPMHAGDYIFNTLAVKDSFISPNGLVEKLTKEFYNDGRQIRDPWEIIGAKINEKRKIALSETLMEDSETMDQNAAVLAAYFTIQSTMPELLQNPYLRLFKDKCEAMLGKNIFENIAKAIEISVNPNPLLPSKPVDIHELKVALMKTFDGDGDEMKAAFKLRNAMAEPGSFGIQSNVQLKRLGRAISESSQPYNMDKIVEEFVHPVEVKIPAYCLRR